MSRPRTTESVFRAIADPSRRRIIELLAAGERTVGDLMGEMRMGKQSATFHLGALCGVGLVRQRRRGRHLMCSLDSRGLSIAHAWLGRYVDSRSRSSSSI